MHATAGGREHSVAGQGFGIGIIFVFAQFLQAQRPVLLAPTVHVWLTQSAPPYLIQVADLPSAALCRRDQSITPFFLASHTRDQDW